MFKSGAWGGKFTNCNKVARSCWCFLRVPQGAIENQPSVLKVEEGKTALSRQGLGRPDKWGPEKEEVGGRWKSPCWQGTPSPGISLYQLPSLCGWTRSLLAEHPPVPLRFISESLPSNANPTTRKPFTMEESLGLGCRACTWDQERSVQALLGPHAM